MTLSEVSIVIVYIPSVPLSEWVAPKVFNIFAAAKNLPKTEKVFFNTLLFGLDWRLLSKSKSKYSSIFYHTPFLHQSVTNRLQYRALPLARQLLPGALDAYCCLNLSSGETSIHFYKITHNTIYCIQTTNTITDETKEHTTATAA